ncbi:MAG TPA: hypothetical protein VIE13_11400, partial [Terriglobales bacterium]
MTARAWLVWLVLTASALGQSLPARWKQWSLPPLDRTAPLQNRDLNWFGLQFHFTQGELTLAAPQDSVVATAVFTGAGYLTVLPPDAAEAGQMLRFSRHTPLREAFRSVVFRLSDSAAFLRQLGPALPFAPGSGRSADDALQQWVNHTHEVRSPEIPRLWLALAAPSPRTWLLAGLKLTSGDWLTAEFDPARGAPLRVLRLSKVAPEVWTEFRPINAPPRVPAPSLQNFQLAVDLANHLAVNVSARFSVRSPGGSPGLLLRLDPDLHVVSAGVAEWLQPDGADWVYIAGYAGQPSTVDLRYHGTPPAVIAGDGGVVTGDWFPQLWDVNPAPPATFDLHFAPQSRYQILAGASTGAGPSAATPHVPLMLARAWGPKTPSPNCAWPQAGFVAAPGQLSTQTLSLASGAPLTLTMLAPDDKKLQLLAPLAGARLLDILNFLSARFGPYPHATAALWLDGPVGGVEPPVPGVIAFSPDNASLQDAQAAAGQWWGAWMRPAAPGDAWLTQGLRAAAGLLYAITRDGSDSALPVLRAWQQLIAGQGGRGPISLGPDRLGPGDAALLPEIKGAYAMYMLRGLMFDASAPDPDAAFTALLRDFAQRHAGEAVTTREFEAAAERHMTPAMDLDRNHSLAWFFAPLLASTSVPVLRFHADSQSATQAGATHLSFTVDNPDGWRGLLPVYVFRDRDHYIRGLMPITSAHNTLSLTV